MSENQVLNARQLRLLSDRMRFLESEISKLAADGGESCAFPVDDTLAVLQEMRQTLHESTRRHVSLMRRMPAIVLELDSDGGIVFANVAVTRLLGYDCDEVIGRTLWSMLRECNPGDYVDRLIQCVRSGDVDEREVVMLTSSGEVRMLQISTCNLLSDGGEVTSTICHCMDLTERRRAETGREDSDRRLQTVFANALDGMLVQELDETGEPSRITEANDVVCRMLGYERSELLGLNRLELRTERGHDSYADFIRRIHEQGRLSYDTEICRRDGSAVTVRIDAQMIEPATGSRVILSTIRDMSEVTTFAEALSEDRFRELVDNLPQAVFEMDLQGRVSFMNKNGRDRFLYSEPGMGAGVNALDFVHPDSRAEVMGQMQSLAGGTVDQGHEYVFVRTDGSLFPGRVYTHVVCRHGRPVGFRGIIVDITETKVAEDRLWLTAEILSILNQPSGKTDMVREILSLLREHMGVEAIGIRLRDGDDFPYYHTIGYDESFVDADRSLCAVDGSGEIVRDVDGLAALECVCGLVLRGAATMEMGNFTPNGAFFCNRATEFFHANSDRLPPTFRGRCVAAGYESVAVIPLRSDGETIGLLQLSDRRPDRMSVDSVRFLEGLGESIGIALKRKTTEESLHESKILIQRITEATPDLQYLLDLKARTMAFTNPQVADSLGYSQADPRDAGQNPIGLVAHQDDRSRLNAYISRLSDLADGEVREITYRVKHTSGEWRWIRSRDTLFARSEDGLPRVVLGTVRDITDRKRSEEDLLRQTARAEALAAVAGRLNEQRDLQSVLRLVCNETARAMGVPAVSIALRSVQADAFRMQAWTPATPEALVQRLEPLSLPVLERCVRDGDSLIVTSSADRIADALNPQVYREFGVQTVASVALGRGDQVIGYLSLYSLSKPYVLSEDDANLLRGLAHQASQAISNARLLEDASRRTGYLQALRDVDKAITASLDLGIILDVFLNHVVTQLDVHAADVLLLDQYSQVLEFASANGLRSRGVRDVYLRLSDSYAGRAARERRLVHVDDLQLRVHHMTRAQHLVAEGFTDYYAVPLIAKGQVHGVLEIFNRSRIDADAEWVDFLEALAGQAAIAIDNASLFEAQQRANTEMLLAYDATLEGWARAMDLHDNAAPGHSLAMAEIAMSLAQALDFPRSELAHVRRGALLHDIGMMGVPESILQKPGPLSVEEVAIVRRHPTAALELLNGIGFLRAALEIPYCHHERWDGSGYPRGLVGEQIPLAARLYAVVDVYDALCSDRPYRRAMGRQEALAAVLDGAGTLFDPRVVEAFQRVIRQHWEP